MKQYIYTLGNTVSRKGHRGDCEHVQVKLEVLADSAEEAEKKLRAGEGRVLGYEVGATRGMPKPEVLDIPEVAIGVPQEAAE